MKNCLTLLKTKIQKLPFLSSINHLLFQVNKDKVKKLAGYEKLKTVGKGAFGAAVLFRYIKYKQIKYNLCTAILSFFLLLFLKYDLVKANF